MKQLWNLIGLVAIISACTDANFSAGERRGRRNAAVNGSDPSWVNSDQKPIDVSETPEFADNGSGSILKNRPGFDPENPNDPNSPLNPDNRNNPPKAGGPENASVDFNVKCDTSNNQVHPIFEYSASTNKKVTANITGEFCPAATNNLRVIFVVDFSASMGKHDRPDLSQIGNPGHDPQVNNSCGRLEALKVIVNKLQSQASSKNLNIDVAFVPFAGGLVQPYEVQPLALADFASTRLSAENICRFVLQSPTRYNTEPGAVVPTVDYNSSTFYSPALRRAYDYFMQRDSARLLYFITDGEPTDPGNGLPAAQLLATVPNLTANSLLLSHDATDARAILEQLTPGQSADRVIDVNNASQLAGAIGTFKVPELDVRSGVATLEVAPYKPKDIGLVSLANGDNLQRTGDIYRYKVNPVVLQGRVNATVSNFVLVTAKGLDGTHFESLVEIKYTMTP